jgi:tetratricopeptide (TPR) repeat protein
MNSRPVIFVSSVSKELHRSRALVGTTLYTEGYDPQTEDIESMAGGDLLGILRGWVDNSDAVLQLVGHCYGAPAPDVGNPFAPCSFTQYEAHYARQQGKRVYYILTEDAYPTDGCGCEPKGLHELQALYRQTIKGYGDLYYSTRDLDDTELLVRRLQDELGKLRAKTEKGNQSLQLKMNVVIGILLSIVLYLAWDHHNQELNKRAQKDLPQTLESMIKGGSEQKLNADYAAALRVVASKNGIHADAFRVFLERDAAKTLKDDDTSLKDKVRALQEAGQFVQARDFALEQARRLESERQKSTKEEAELWTEAAKTELAFGHYDKALEYATQGVNQTDRKADFSTWSASRYQQGRALRYLGEDKEAQKVFEELIPLEQTAFGLDHLAVIRSRRILALTLFDQGYYDLAEQQGSALVADCQRVLGPEHPETLASQNNLAVVFSARAEYGKAEQELRKVLKVMERVLGPEHPDTLKSRTGVANALHAQEKYADAEKENLAVLKARERLLGAEHPDTLMSRSNLAEALRVGKKTAEAEREHRAVLAIRERVLSAEHPDILASRNNLAVVLDDLGNHADAEREHRAVLAIRERIRTAEHPDVAQSCYNLGLCLEAQKQLPEALGFVQRAEQIWTKVLGPDHPDTKRSKADRERIEEAMKVK